MTSKALDKLRDPEYRKAFVASQINFGIPFQIRAMLKARPGWTQRTLADKTDMLQPRISGLMTPGKTRPNIETLRRVAEAFDCGLVVRFAPFSELLGWSKDFDPESFNVPGFETELADLERAEAPNRLGNVMNIRMIQPAVFTGMPHAHPPGLCNQKQESEGIVTRWILDREIPSTPMPMKMAYTTVAQQQSWERICVNGQ